MSRLKTVKFKGRLIDFVLHYSFKQFGFGINIDCTHHINIIQCYLPFCSFSVIWFIMTKVSD